MILRYRAWLIAGLLIAAASSAVQAQTAPATRPVARIGVLANRSSDLDDARRIWQPTADYLSGELGDITFHVVPFGFNQLADVGRDIKVDFLIVNPAIYIDFEVRYEATRIATLRMLYNGVECRRFGAVIFTRADRTDITSLNDLRGKRFIAADRWAFGGWLMAWREFRDAGIDVNRHFASLQFLDGPQDGVVYAVRDRHADAGTVRTDQLQFLAGLGRINPADFKILNVKDPVPDFPFVRSTDLYPEWPFVAMKHTPHTLSHRVAIALMRMPPDSAAARAAGCAGWTVPLNYTSVHDCLKALHVSPYDKPEPITLKQASREYGLTVLLALTMLLLAGLLVALRVNRRLNRLQASLHEELSQRQAAEHSLRLNELRAQALLRLSEMPEASLKQITDFALEEGVRLTGSTVGYLAFVNEDETVLTMHSWSRNAMASCAISQKPIIYPLNTTGLWGEPVRQRRPIITNDYAAPNPWKKGTPVGHVPVTRHMNIPVFDGEHIVAVAGVGNKTEPYDDSDVTQLRLLMDGMWRLIQRQRSAEAIRRMNEELELRVHQRTAELEQSVRSEREAMESLKKAQGLLVQSEKLAALGQLVAGVAHEINNPLAFVSNNTAVLQRDISVMRELLALYARADHDIAQYLPEISAQIRQLGERVDLPYTLANLQGVLDRSRDGLRRIQQIVRDLRDFARLDESEFHETDLNTGIESTVNIVQGQARKKNVQIALELTPLPPVSCQPSRINQVVLNLVTNAIDACAPGGVVVVRTRPDDHAVCIEVCDNGTGIDPAIRDRIFDPFFTTKSTGEGTGLGLSISYGIVRDHAGRIDLESEPGKGSRFIIHLPLNPRPEGRPPKL